MIVAFNSKSCVERFSDDYKVLVPHCREELLVAQSISGLLEEAEIVVFCKPGIENFKELERSLETLSLKLVKYGKFKANLVTEDLFAKLANVNAELLEETYVLIVSKDSFNFCTKSISPLAVLDVVSNEIKLSNVNTNNRF